MHLEPVTETEIEAYLDGELDLDRRLAVETHLASDPAAAQRFMEELRIRTSLRLLADDLGEPPTELRAAAARLAGLGNRPPRRLRNLWTGRALQGLAAAALLALVLLPARDVVASPRDFVDDAVEAYRAGLLRAAMVSQAGTPRFDPAEIERSTQIRVPRLPAEWKITDAQIFPSRDGPALQLMVRTPDAEQLSIFVAHADSGAPEDPKVVEHEGTAVAYWREGPLSYALTGVEEPEILDLVAEELAEQPPQKPVES